MTHYVSTRIREDTAHEQTAGDDGFGSDSKYPNWAQWIDGEASIDSDGAIQPAVGGEYSEKPQAVIDLTGALGEVLGRQITQNQTFRISYLGVTIENDDAGTNNDEALAASGRFRWYTPQLHRVNAYQMYRKCWKTFLTGGDASSSVFSHDYTSGEYKGLRMGLSDGIGFEIPYPSGDPFSDITGSYPNLYNVLEAYDEYVSSGEGSSYTNRLWRHGRTGYPEAISWTAANSNPNSANGLNARNFGFHQSGLEIEAMLGLLHFTVDSTQSDGLFADADEYHIRVTVGIDGWGGEF